jgi:hypothetical protein
MPFKSKENKRGQQRSRRLAYNMTKMVQTTEGQRELLDLLEAVRRVTFTPDTKASKG